ncbi:MAG: DUF2723 domain-containing protein [Caldilineaceae bacterium]|nr:DUF2723 domain-containing protein [Caldilineaceae bacterium]
MVKFFPNAHSRADRQFALLLFATTLGLYLRTVAPGLLAGDAGEFQVAAWQLGLAHPTGYPLYLLLGNLWQHLLVLAGFTPAYALNVFSALAGATTVALLYLCMINWLTSPLWVRRLAALLTATLLAVNFTFWSQNLIAEVYTLHTLFLVLIFAVATHLFTPPQPPETTPALGHVVVGLALLVGLALTHHAMTLLLLPSLALLLWQSRRTWLPQRWTLPLALVAGATPLLLYFYIPLRSGPAASPWYHQTLGSTTLTLYDNSWSAFWQFITGQSIAVGFYSVTEALQQLPQAWLLWRLHLLWPGLVLAGFGLYLLVRRQQWSLLALTVPFFLFQQIFNLFYAIGDILVYYIPLYLVAAIWAGVAADTIGGGAQSLMQRTEVTVQPKKPQRGTPPLAPRPPLQLGMVLTLALFWVPLQLIMRDFARLDQSNATAAQTEWQAIATAVPTATTPILVSNDRNEIVPLFYLQAVEQQLPGVTGLFPLLAPDQRFADIGATLETARNMAPDRPLYLIKPMPGLESRFDLTPATPPLVQVNGPITATPQVVVGQPYGPLQLLGYDWHATAETLAVTLYWQVQAPPPGDYTTTVQLFAANGEKVAQQDAAPGGVYYPTSHWKTGEVLVDRHTLPTPDQVPVTLLVGMYLPTNMSTLAPALELPLNQKDAD